MLTHIARHWLRIDLVASNVLKFFKFIIIPVNMDRSFTSVDFSDASSYSFDFEEVFIKFSVCDNRKHRVHVA
jgi:hypothetical protein